MVSQKVLEDPVAISLAEAVAAANEQDSTGEGIKVWRFNYLPILPPGLTMRGGDFMVEVNAADGTIHQALRGQ